MKPSTAFSATSSSAILCVGEPGSGKTRLSMAFPDPGILDNDGNLSSAVRVSPTKKFFFSKPYEDDEGKPVDEKDRWKRAMSETKALVTHPETKSFIVDGLSNLCRWGLTHAENELVLAGINVKKEYLAKYNAFIPLLLNYITYIRSHGKPVVVNVHQVVDKDELTGAVRYFLDIPGRLSSTLGGQFTDVWGMSSLPDPQSKLGAKYIIRTKPSGYHPNLKTSLDLEPSIDISGKSPAEIWSLLEPKLSINVKKS